MKLIFTIFIILIYSSNTFGQSCRDNKFYKQLRSLRSECAGKSVHLTFDDGPDPKLTPQILNTLNKNGVKASFYITTDNLVPGKKNDTLISMIRTGHVVASHGHEHKAHDLKLNGNKCDPDILTPSQSERQIERSLALLQAATGGLFERQPHKLFRFPYGRGAMPSAKELGLMLRHGQSSSACTPDALKHAAPLEQEAYKEALHDYKRFRSSALQRVHGASRDHVGWNFDSMDSNSKVAKKAKSNPTWYLKETLTKMCEAKDSVLVALFHDSGKDFNAKIMNELIETAKCLGINFLSYDELLEHRDYLANRGILVEAPREDNDILGEFIEQILANEEHQSKSTRKCSEDELSIVNTCVSSNGKTYKHCQGESSICLNGKWLPKTDSRAIERCGPRSCFSKFSGKTFAHCQGSSSICVNGDWLKRSEAVEVCGLEND